MTVRVELPPELVEEIVALVTERVRGAMLREQGRRWLSIAEAAAELGLSEGAIRKHVARNGIESTRVGGRIFVDMHSLGAS
jgi:excisionase family DNA binding protein